MTFQVFVFYNIFIIIITRFVKTRKSRNRLKNALLLLISINCRLCYQPMYPIRLFQAMVKDRKNIFQLTESQMRKKMRAYDLSWKPHPVYVKTLQK